jgi:hypothetical protein
MTILDRRRQLQQQIAQLPDDQLTQVEQYLAFLGFQKTVPSQSEVTKSPSTGASILASLDLHILRPILLSRMRRSHNHLKILPLRSLK